MGFLLLLFPGSCKGVILSTIQKLSGSCLQSSGTVVRNTLLSMQTFCSKYLMKSSIISSQHFSASQENRTRNEPWGHCLWSLHTVKEKPHHHWFLDHLFFSKLSLALYLMLSWCCFLWTFHSHLIVSFWWILRNIFFLRFPLNKTSLGITNFVTTGYL